LGKKEGGTLSPTTAIVLLSAMSVHSLFETMALGIASDHVSATLMAISIALHQPAESMALLVAFLKTSMPKQAIIRWLGLFSGVGIVGVALGLIISQVANPFVDAVLVAITAGTFLYVGATEICNEEFEEGSTKDKLIKFSALAGGIAIIGLISSVSERWLESSHGHSH
jgi:zinc transporter 1/2/3